MTLTWTSWSLVGALAVLHAMLSGFFVYFVSSQQNCPGTKQVPALGDIMVDVSDDEVVKIYFTDGTEQPVWAPICANTGGHSLYVVICRQLGYQGLAVHESHKLNGIRSNVSHQNRTLSQRTQYYHHIDCGDEPTYSHIFQCNHSFTSTCNKSKTDTLNFKDIGCTNPLNPKQSPGYDGEVYLCPPNNFPSRYCSVSTGLVRLSLHIQWRGINQNSPKPLGSREADSICRQLGYTGAVPNSAVTVKATSNPYYSHCFFDGLSSHAWFKTDQLHCDTTQDCLGCCFDYPQSDNDYCHGCDNTNDIIVSCTFDPTASQQLPVMEERSSVCRFHNKSLSHSSCSNPTQVPVTVNPVTGTEYTLKILLLSSIVPAVGILLICGVFLVISITVGCCCYWRQIEYRGYRQLPGDIPHGDNAGDHLPLEPAEENEEYHDEPEVDQHGEDPPVDADDQDAPPEQPVPPIQNPPLVEEPQGEIGP